MKAIVYTSNAGSTADDSVVQTIITKYMYAICC